MKNPIKHKGWKLVEDFSSKFHVAPDLEAYKAKQIYLRQYGKDNVRMDIRDTPSGGTWAGVYIRASILRNPGTKTKRRNPKNTKDLAKSFVPLAIFVGIVWYFGRKK